MGSLSSAVGVKAQPLQARRDTSRHQARRATSRHQAMRDTSRHQATLVFPARR